MALNNSELTILIKAQNDTKKTLDEVSANIKKLNKNTEKSSKIFAGLSGKINTAVKAFAGFFAISKIVGFLKESVTAFQNEERAVARLTSVMRNVNNATNEQIELLKQQAAELQKTTNFGDEQIISAQAMLGTFQLTSEEIQKLTPRILDMGEAMVKSTGTGTDLESITIAVGKAMTLGVGSLTRYGVVITEAQKTAFELANRQEKVKILTEALDSNFKEIAAGSAQTFAGQVIKLKNVFGDFKESVGKAVSVLTKDMVWALGVNIEGMNENETNTYALIIAVNKLKIAFYSLGTGILQNWERVKIGSAKLNKFLFGWVDKKTSNFFQKQIDESSKTIERYGDTLAGLVGETDKMNQELKSGTFDWEKYLGKIKESNNLITPFVDNTKKTTEELKRQADAVKKLNDQYADFKKKINDVKKSVEAEGISFTKNMMEKQMTYKERLAEMVADHKEKWQKANKELQELEQKGLSGMKNIEKFTELRQIVEKEFKIVQPYLNDAELKKLAERSDIEKLTESYRREQAIATVESATKTQELINKERQIYMNFDFSNSTITDETIIEKIKSEINKSFNILKFSH